MTATPPSETPAKPAPVVEPVALEGGGWGLALHGRPLKTPARRPLVLPTAELAALCAEADGGPLPPARRLAFTSIDRVADVRGEVADEIARYAGSDLLCYFAEGPQALVERETSQWDPWLDWAQQQLGLTFVRARGVAHAAQPPATLERVRALALELDDFRLAGLASATPLLGSAILGFALQRGALSGAAAFDLSRLDEAFQEERWGVDAEAAQRTAALAEEVRRLDRWFRACEAEPH